MSNSIDKTYLGLILLFCILSCSHKGRLLDNDKFIVFKQINIDNKVLNTFKSTYPNFVISGNEYISNFKFTNEEGESYTLDYRFQKMERCDDFINMDSIQYNITKVDEKSFIVGNQTFRITKYYYDELNSYDEEETILINEKIGILFIHQYWGETYEIMSHPDMNNDVLNKLKMLIKDNKGFYKNWNSCIWN